MITLNSVPRLAISNQSSTNMYEKFLDKNPNSICQTVDDVFIAKYANVVSENIITLWKEVGFGMFCEGLFRIIEPNEYQAIIDDCYPMAGFGSATPFMTTVFGDIFAYVKDCRIGDYVVFVNVRYGTFRILSDKVDILFNIVLFNKGCLSSWFSLDEYPIIKSAKDIPALDECYGYVPALALGGKEAIDNIHILKTIPYIEMSLQSIGDLKRVQ